MKNSQQLSVYVEAQGLAMHFMRLTYEKPYQVRSSCLCDFKNDTDLLLAGELTAEDKARLDELHLRKIDLAHEVLFLNVNDYLGESTKRELAYAREHHKVIRFLEDHQ